MSEIAADEIPLINQALSMVGASPIQSLEQESDLAEKAKAHWPEARDHCLAIHPTGWGWARKTYALSRDPRDPINGFTYAYALPGDAIGGAEALFEQPAQNPDPLRHYALEEGLIFADTATLYGRFPVNPAVALWPPLFRLAVKTLAAAKYAIPLSHDAKLAADFRKQAIGDDREGGAGGILGRAIAQDLSQRPLGSPLLRSDPLTSARFE